MEYDTKFNELLKYSDPYIVFKNAKHIFGDDVLIYISTRKNKKYMIWNPEKQIWVHFGAMGYEDYTYHKNKLRRMSYRLRASNIKGDWRDDEYSPNNLSINLLWG